ncbi:probable E3 ubiquitin-protein ligase plr-1 [Papaver somniferum]|uniref:probable E3 ubiquitin-protein ligase plr-1 n=1 Tax=Papaver somniferum TaxID=3469 RepID=UPI000E704151|nr:probable E3 ubiquitin-protein ligase plr-1 [Papaver somniferum]
MASNDDSNRTLQNILSLVRQLKHYARSLGFNGDAIILPVVYSSKELGATFQGGDRMMRIEAIKKLLMDTLSSLIMPAGKTGLYKSLFIEIANLCDRLLRLQRRGSEDLPLSGLDGTITSLYTIIRIQGLDGLECLMTRGTPSSFVQPREEKENAASRDQTKPVKHSSDNDKVKIKSEGDENRKCPICLEIIKDEKDEKGTASLPNCSHRFHFHCILKWMEKKQNCPICRSVINPEK